MTVDPVAAKELTQDVFVRVWEKLHTFRGESAFTSWLHRLTVNVVLLDRRTTARRAEDPLEDDNEDSPIPSADAIAAARRARRPELRLDLEQAISKLPPMARRVLVLYELEGFSHAEVGAMLGIAEGTSKAHLFRARALLREMLER